MQSNQYSAIPNSTSNNRGQQNFAVKQPPPRPSNQEQLLGNSTSGLASSSSSGATANKPRQQESRPGLFGSSNGLPSSSSSNRPGGATTGPNSQTQTDKPQPAGTQGAAGNSSQPTSSTPGTSQAAGSNQRPLFGTSASNPVLVGPQPTTGTRAKRPVAGSVNDLFLMNPHKEFDINAPNFADFLTTKENPSRASRFLKEYIKNQAFMRFSHMIFPLLQRENIEWRQMKLLAESVGVDEKYITYPNRNYMLRDFIVIVYEGIIGNRKVIDLSRNLTAWNKLFQFHKFEDVDAADDPGSKFFLKDGKIVISTGFLLDRRPYPPRGERQPNNFELSRLYKDTCICGKQTTTTSHSITVSCKVPGCKMKFHRTCVGWIDDRSGAWFECPRCALTSNDPLHEVEDTLMDPSLLVKKTDYSFALTEEQVQKIKDSKTLAVEVRCMKLKYAHYFEHTWPETMKCYLNEHLIVDERPSCERHRKDQKYSTRRNLLPGRNTLRVTFYDIDEFSRAQGKYILGVFLVNKLDRLKLSEHIIKNNEVSDEREKIFVTALVQEYGELGAEKFTCDLNCKLTLKPIKVPVRGQYCTHVQCFSLDSYLMIQVGAKHRCWSCQICGKPAHRLLYDKFFSRITFAAMDEKAKTGKVFTKFTVDRDLNYKLLTDEDAVGVIQEPTQKIPDPPIDNDKEGHAVAEAGGSDADCSPPPERASAQNRHPAKLIRNSGNPSTAAPIEKPSQMVAEDDEDVLIDEEKSAPAKIAVTSSDEEGDARETRAITTKKPVFHSEDDEDDLPARHENPQGLDANGYLMYPPAPYYSSQHSLASLSEDRYAQIAHRTLESTNTTEVERQKLTLAGPPNPATSISELALSSLPQQPPQEAYQAAQYHQPHPQQDDDSPETQTQTPNTHAALANLPDYSLSTLAHLPNLAASHLSHLPHTGYYPYYGDVYGYDVYYPDAYYDDDPRTDVLRAQRLRQADEGERMFGEDERGGREGGAAADGFGGGAGAAGLAGSHAGAGIAGLRDGRRERRGGRRGEPLEAAFRPSGRDGRYRNRRGYQRDEELEEFVARDEEPVRRGRRQSTVDAVDDDTDVVEIEEEENRENHREHEFLDGYTRDLPESQFDYDDTEDMRPFGRAGSRVSFKNRVYDRYDTERPSKNALELDPLYQAEVFRRDFRRDISKKQPRSNQDLEDQKNARIELDEIKKLLESDSPTKVPTRQNQASSSTNAQDRSGDQFLGKRSYMNIDAEDLDDDISDDVPVVTKDTNKDHPSSFKNRNSRLELESRPPLDFMQEFRPQTQSIALDIDALDDDLVSDPPNDQRVMIDSFDSAENDNYYIKRPSKIDSRMDQGSVSVELGRDSQEHRQDHYETFGEKDFQKGSLFDRETGSTQVSTVRNELPSEELQPVGVNKLSPIFKTTLATRYHHEDLKFDGVQNAMQESSQSPWIPRNPIEKSIKLQRSSDLFDDIPFGEQRSETIFHDTYNSRSDSQFENGNLRQHQTPLIMASTSKLNNQSSEYASARLDKSETSTGNQGSINKGHTIMRNNPTTQTSGPANYPATSAQRFVQIPSDYRFQTNTPQSVTAAAKHEHVLPTNGDDVPVMKIYDQDEFIQKREGEVKELHQKAQQINGLAYKINENIYQQVLNLHIYFFVCEFRS